MTLDFEMSEVNVSGHTRPRTRVVHMTQTCAPSSGASDGGRVTLLVPHESRSHVAPFVSGKGKRPDLQCHPMTPEGLSTLTPG